MPREPTAEEKAREADKAGDKAFKDGDFDRAAGDYGYAAEQYLKAEQLGLADMALIKEVGAIVRGGKSLQQLKGEARALDGAAEDIEIRAQAQRSAGKLEGSGGASELFPQAAAKRMKAGLLRRAEGLLLRRANQPFDAANADSDSAESFRKAADDYETAAACEGANDGGEKRAEYRAAELARTQAMAAGVSASVGYARTGYKASADTEDQRVLRDIGARDDDYLNATR